MTSSEQVVLVKWLNTEFKDACFNDNKRLLESAWIMKMGVDNGDPTEKIVARMIASFVHGLILDSQPITVPTENN